MSSVAPVRRTRSKSTAPKVGFVSLGCPKALVDSERILTQLRAEGSAVSERTRAEADRQRTEILADAYRRAEIVRGEGDAAALHALARLGRRQRALRVLRQVQQLPLHARRARGGGGGGSF